MPWMMSKRNITIAIKNIEINQAWLSQACFTRSTELYSLKYRVDKRLKRYYHGKVQNRKSGCGNPPPAFRQIPFDGKSISCRCGSEVEQFIRNERVVSSILTTGSNEIKSLKLECFKDFCVHS